MKYKRVGIICAMEIEAEALRNAMNNRREERIGTLRFDLGTVGEREVILAVCGIGKVFAAMCTQSMILKYAPNCILNSGVAGSLSEEVDLLDLVVSEDLVQHDMDTSPLGDPVGWISGLDRIRLSADPTLREGILKAALQEGIPAKMGTVASGDQFIASSEQKERIRQNFSPLACEMEGAAIAQVCVANQVPFCVIRAISDSYTGQNEMDYPRFAGIASRRGAEFLLSLLRSCHFLP